VDDGDLDEGLLAWVVRGGKQGVEGGKVGVK
jgi:hypothetical protein